MGGQLDKILCIATMLLNWCNLFTRLLMIIENCQTSWQSGFVANMLLPLSNISGYLKGVLKILPRYILKSCHRTAEYTGIAKP